MSETSPHSEAIVRHNPFDDPKPKRRPGTIIALLLAIIVAGVAVINLYSQTMPPH